MDNMSESQFTHRFVINEHLDVAWDSKEDRVQVLVDGKPVLHCAFLVAAVSPIDDDITCIDDLTSVDGFQTLESKSVRGILTIEEEVHAHASNIQAWAEHDYDPHLLHSNIAFTLLKVLSKAGDAKARRVLESEIDARWYSGNKKTKEALLDNCPGVLDWGLIEGYINSRPKRMRFDYWTDLGDAFDDSGDLASAIAAYRKALDIEPDRDYFWNILAAALQRSGDVKGSVEAFRKALAINPGDAQAWYCLGPALAESGDVTGGIAACRQAISVDNGDPSAWHNLSCVLTMAGNVQEAIEASKTAISLRYSVGMHWTGLGEALEASGDVDAAIEAYRIALSLDPEENSAKEDLRRLDKLEDSLRTKKPGTRFLVSRSSPLAKLVPSMLVEPLDDDMKATKEVQGLPQALAGVFLSMGETNEINGTTAFAPPQEHPVTQDSHLAVTEENIIKLMTEGKQVELGYIIKALNISEIWEARFLELKLKTLVDQGKIGREYKDGISFYKKV